MRPLNEAAVFERSVSVFGVAALILLVLAAVFVHTRWSAVLALPALLYPALFLADLQYWPADFGQNLDPTAPLSSSIEPFVPPVLGNGNVGQFSTTAVPDIGLWLAIGASVLIVVGLWFHRRARRAAGVRSRPGAGRGRAGRHYPGAARRLPGTDRDRQAGDAGGRGFTCHPGRGPRWRADGHGTRRDHSRLRHPGQWRSYGQGGRRDHRAGAAPDSRAQPAGGRPVRDLAQASTGEHPELRLFQLGPAADALDMAAAAFPVFQPRAKMSDEYPLMAPPALAAVPGLPQVPRAGNLLVGLAMLALAVGILVGGTRTGRRGGAGGVSWKTGRP